MTVFLPPVLYNGGVEADRAFRPSHEGCVADVTPLDRGWGRAFGDRTIMHVDMDAFFAQVEVLDNPEYAGKPLVVGGTSERGVVSTCSYEARRYGIHSAMPATRARKLCPHAIFVKPRMERYSEVARHIRSILASFSPLIEPLSIDEAFLDMTGCEHFYEDAVHMGSSVKQAIRSATGLTASVGIAPNKFLAKLASDRNKPDGLCIIPLSEVDRILPPLSVDKLWGVGPKTARRLQEYGIRTVADVRKRSVDELSRIVGDRSAAHIRALAFGLDDRPVVTDNDAQSLGKETTFDVDVPDGPELRGHLARLASSVGWRLRRKGLYARTVTVKIRYPDFTTHTKSRTLSQSFQDDDTIFSEASALLDEFRLRRPLRLLGVYVSYLETYRQPSLFDETDDRLTAVIDALNLRHGRRIVRKGREL